MRPRPGTKTAAAIDYIEKHPGARSREISDACGMAIESVATSLAPWVTNGTLICCKVERPGAPTQNEYRMGSGIQPRTSVPEMRARTPQPRVGQNIGRVSLGTLLPETSLPEGHAVAAAPSPAVPPVATKPGRAGARDVNEITLSMDDEGRLTMRITDGQSDPLRLSAQETLALGDFLHATEGLWRA